MQKRPEVQRSSRYDIEEMPLHKYITEGIPWLIRMKWEQIRGKG